VEKNRAFHVIHNHSEKQAQKKKKEKKEKEKNALKAYQTKLLQ